MMPHPALRALTVRSRTRFSPTGRMVAALLGFSSLLTPTAGVAQATCPDGVISRVEVRSLDPYDEEGDDPSARFGWAYRALNWLHLETRETVIRWELLFEEGMCFDALRLSESERILRALPYLSSASVTSTRNLDGTHHVEVVTRDSWAVSANLGVDFEDGIDVTGVQASYLNVLGFGLRGSLFRRAFRERLRTGLLARHSNLFGTRVGAIVHGGDTRSGRYLSASIRKPFENEFARHAFRQTYARRDDYFGYTLPPELGFTPAYLRYEAELVEFSYQTRWGPEDGRRAILGLGVSSESFKAPFGVEGTRAVVDGDYEQTEVAPAAVRNTIARQASPFSTKRVSVTVGLRDVRFVLREGLDAIRGEQDLMVGVDATVTVAPGLAIEAQDRSDVLTRLQGRVGLLGEGHYWLTRLDVQARHSFGEAGIDVGPSGWRDLVGSLRVDGFIAESDWASLYLRGALSGGWQTDRPFQLRLGGREAVRAYTEDAFPGGRAVVLSAEQRFTLDPVSPPFADLGLAVFVDAGRMWAGDAPFGRDSGWQSGIGAGLRMSPSGGRRVFRIDTMLPLGDQRTERGISLRLSGEILGVLERRRWPSQIDRSRWYGVDPDLSRRVADPLAGN